MSKPEVVVFDLGKVLLDFDYSISSKKISARSRISYPEIQEFIDHSPLLMRYEKGQMSRRAFFEEICTMSGFDGSPEEFASFFADIFDPIVPMVELNRQLRGNSVQTFIFSNTNDLAIEHIRDQYEFFKEFDDYVLSYEHGSMKPEPALYHVVERVTGRRGEQILYFDDRIENVEGGARQGWQAVQHSDPQLSISVVRDAGLLG